MGAWCLILKVLEKIPKRYVAEGWTPSLGLHLHFFEGKGRGDNM